MNDQCSNANHGGFRAQEYTSVGWTGVFCDNDGSEDDCSSCGDATKQTADQKHGVVGCESDEKPAQEAWDQYHDVCPLSTVRFHEERRSKESEVSRCANAGCWK